MRHIIILARKEIKELLTKQLLIPIIVMVFFFGFIGRLMKGEMKKASIPKPILVADYDHSKLSDYIKNTLGQNNIIVKESSGNIEALVIEAQKSNISTILILPESLEKKYQLLQRPTIPIYSLLNSLSPFSDIGSATLKSALGVINESLGVRIIKNLKRDAPISTIKKPLSSIDYVSFKNQIIQADPIQIKDTIRVQNVFLPVILLMVIIYISQMIAAAMGQEKENKTLETLLTFPVSRFQILIGKMLGAAAVAILMSAVFLIGMKFYMTPITQIGGSAAPALAKSNVTIGPSQTLFYVVTTLSLFLSIICAASLATLLTLFATDAKQAQTIVMPINILVIFPYFIALVLDINTLSIGLKAILYIIPFTYPFLMSQALFFNQTTLIIGGMIYMVVFAIVVTAIAAKIFSSDRILTAKLRIRR
jgi:ABC-2 type transport system permease protein